MSLVSGCTVDVTASDTERQRVSICILVTFFDSKINLVGGGGCDGSSRSQ